MNKFSTTPNHYFKQNNSSIIKTKSNTGLNLYLNKRKKKIYISNTYNNTYNRNTNLDKNISNTNYYKFNKAGDNLHDNYYYFNNFKYYNNNTFNNENENNIISTIKKSFERLKNKINSLQKIMNDNSTYNKGINIYKKQTYNLYCKSSDKIKHNKNIFNNIYFNIEEEDKDIITDNNFLSNILNNQNERNTMFQKPIDNFNIKNPEIQIKYDNNLKDISKKYYSANNIVLTNFPNYEKDLKSNELNKNKNINDQYINNFYNYKNININNRFKTSSESENISELANDLILFSKNNNNFINTNNNLDLLKRNLKTFSYKNKEFKNNYDSLNNNPNNKILVNKNNKINKLKNFNNTQILKQSKENDIFLKPTILKVDEGTNVRIPMSPSNNNCDLNNHNNNNNYNNYNNENYTIKVKRKANTNNEKQSLKIMTNEIINITNNKLNFGEKENNYKIDNNISFYYSLSNDCKIKNKNNNKRIFKSKNNNNRKSKSKDKVIKLNTLNDKKEYKTKKLIKNKKNNLILKTKKFPKNVNKKSFQQIHSKTETNLSVKNKFEKSKKLINTKTPKDLIKKEEFIKNVNNISFPKYNTVNSTKYKNTNNNNKNNDTNLSKKYNHFINNSKNLLKKNRNNKNIIKNQNKTFIDSRRQSITSQDERDDLLITQIMLETESQIKKKENLHIQFDLEKNTFITYNQNDLVENNIYTNNKNKEISHKKFDINIYNEILKSKINLIPSIKKNYNINDFKIDKNYKLNENMEEKDIIPELYLEYNVEEDFKILEKTLEKSIEKTFNRKYEKRKEENNMNYSDNKSDIKINKTIDDINNNNNYNNNNNLFHKIQQMFSEESGNEFESENDDYIIENEDIYDNISKESNEDEFGDAIDSEIEEDQEQD